MTENDNDKLLVSFFAEHKHEIADNGFSRRVLRRLPGYRLSQIWTICCFTLAFVLLVAFDGVQAILNALREIFETALRSGFLELDPTSLAIVGGVLLFGAYRKISSLA